MSDSKKEQPKVEEVDEEDAPELLGDQDAAGIDEAALRQAMAGAAGKSSKRYAKAMAKLGLKPEPNVVRILFRKKGQNFTVAQPEVYHFPNTHTFVIFGDAQSDDDAAHRAQAMMAAGARPPAAAATSAAAATTAAAATSAAATAAGGDDDNVDAGDIGEKEIQLVMSQANVTRGKAIRALQNNKGDIVNTIMELTM